MRRGQNGVADAEDEFSLLQDEMEKTVTALYETREEAVKAKEGYARHLTDIAIS